MKRSIEGKHLISGNQSSSLNMQLSNDLKKTILLTAIFVFMGFFSAYSIHVVVYGKGGVSGDSGVQVCPEESSAKCAELTISSDELDDLLKSSNSGDHFKLTVTGNTILQKEDGSTGSFNYTTIEFNVVESGDKSVEVSNLHLYGTFE